MKILGIDTEANNLIVLMSQEEWNAIILNQSLPEPLDLTRIYDAWLRTEAGEFFIQRDRKIGEGTFRHMWNRGKFDGTLKELRKLLIQSKGDVHLLMNIGPKKRAIILEDLDRYEMREVNE